MSSFGHYGSMKDIPDHRALRGAEDVAWSLVEGRAEDYPDLGGDVPVEIPYNERLRQCGEDITELVVEKNLAYGDAVNKVAAIMRILFPHGIEPRQYRDMLLLVRDLDKTCRLADGDPGAFDESPWKDKAGYAICGMAVDR